MAANPATESNMKIERQKIEAILLDLDGVITHTATVHSKAWKSMFDEFNRHRESQGDAKFPEFTLPEDYQKHLDGIPRYDGVANFLQSRNIELPRGNPEDKPGFDTICALGNLKNEKFGDVLEKEGVEVFPDALEALDFWERHQFKLAVISSSKNCRLILERADLLHRFEVVVDGNTLRQESLPGKPEPDIFLEAAGKLKVDRSAAAVLEDARAGVKAGHKGNFGLVIGVARNDEAQMLLENGADFTVRKLTELI
jgi:alpha,alpha-trehalase